MVDEIISQGTQSSPAPRIKTSADQSREMIETELSKSELLPLMDFLMEYHGHQNVIFGYLFEQYPNGPNLKPLLRKTRNPKSPLYCAKIPVRGLGNVFVIPLSPASEGKVAIVFKPDRSLRRSIQINKATIPGSEVTLLHYPYRDIVEKLTLWAVSYEASLRSK